MAFEIPTRESLFSTFISDFAGAQPTKNVSRGSDTYRLGRVVSGVAWSILARLLYFLKQMLPDTAEREFLLRWGNVFSFPPREAQGSSGLLALRVTGTVGNAITNGALLTHSDGTTYQNATVGAVVGGSGYVDIDINAVSTGLATNKVIGEVLTFSSPDSGIDADGTLVVALTNGLNVESWDEYRVRLLAHIGDPPEGGAIHDYEEWLKSQVGVKTAYVWAHRRGAGTIDLAVLGYGTGSARIITDTSDIDTYIESVRPGGVRDVAILTPTVQAQDVTVEITIDETLYKWDWDDAGVGYAISAHDSALQTITVTTAPAAVVAGVRITVLGEEAMVTNRTGNVLTLAFEDDYDGNAVSWFTFTVSTQDIRASGDLVKPVRNAIIGLFNTLGPARSDYSETSWISDLRKSKLFAAITDVPGVDDADLVTPSSTVTPTDDYGDDLQIPFLVPGNIMVLKP